MLVKWKKADLQDALTCSSIDGEESNTTLIFRAVFDGLITASPMVTAAIGGDGRCFALRIKSSVLLLFNLSKFCNIHLSISLTQALFLVFASSANDDSGDRQTFVNARLHSVTCKIHVNCIIYMTTRLGSHKYTV